MADNLQLVLPKTGIFETDFGEHGVPCRGNSNTVKPVEQALIEISAAAVKKSGSCCGPRA